MAQRALFYECFAGIAGDMHLGALIDVGVPAEHLVRELNRLELAPEFELVIEPGKKMGITGTRVAVRLVEDIDKPHRHLSTIKGILTRAGYPPRVEDLAVSMFTAIAVAEAKIHGTTVEAIHFHEVGATDSIVDIAGAAIGIDYLDIDVAYSSAVEVGSGMVRCEHGLMPVPAPATAEILKNAPCRYAGVDGEATTPTGAAILASVVDRFEAPRDLTATAVGYGIGHRDFTVPNALRLTLGNVPDARADIAIETETNIEVECNIDDMTPEAFGPLTENLFAKGAKDVFLTPIVMKKSRPATKLSLLVDEARLDAVLAELFAGSTTIGARTRQVTKRMLPREARTVTTSLGDIRVKVVTLPDGSRRWKPEHDDIAAVAERQGTDYLTTRAALSREIDAAIE
ncbi:MAG: nickel pincer cofactor biosynthesis protein LarC [Gammaproteobacteria bacterium]|nr:nickel pincer cofactor biosynthesis protein LarC [Gammaproteobacteria bacterium]